MSEPGSDHHDRELLLATLQRLRETVVRKAEGLTEEQARQPHPPSSITLIALLRHLADAERTWFLGRFAGRVSTAGWSAERSWRVKPGDTLASVIALYRAQCAESDRVVRAHPLDAPARGTGGGDGLLTVLVHMIQETARHAGHAPGHRGDRRHHRHLTGWSRHRPDMRRRQRGLRRPGVSP